MINLECWVCGLYVGPQIYRAFDATAVTSVEAHDSVHRNVSHMLCVHYAILRDAAHLPSSQWLMVQS
jgi:hypothetical protein